MSSDTGNTASEQERWLICPICKQPNPVDAYYCHHCWGASLYSAEPVTTEEAAETAKRWQSHLKRLSLIKVIAVSVVAPLTLFLVVFFGLYNLTDFIFAPPATLSSSPFPGEWTMFRRDLGHSGSNGLDGASPEGTLKWEFSTGDAIHSSPAVVDGVVYIGSRDNKLYALDAATGDKLWEYETGSWVESSPAVVNGVVYFGSNDGTLYALDARNGKKLWGFHTRFRVTSSPAVAGGMVYFGKDDYHVYALDTLTGTKIWDYNVGTRIASSPAVANGIVYIGAVNGSFYALHALDGRLRLKYLTPEIVSSPAVNDGNVYINSRGFLYAIDGYARNWIGEHRLYGWWLQFYALRVAPPPPPVSGHLWRLKVGLTSHSSPAVTDDTIYTTADNLLYSIDRESHTMNWVFVRAKGTLKSSPAVGDNAIYVGSDDHRLYAVDATTGLLLWDFRTGGKISSSPALADGTVYVGSHDGKVYAIE